MKLELTAAHRFDREVMKQRLRRNVQSFAFRERQQFVLSVRVSLTRAARLLRKHTGRPAKVIGLAEVKSGKQLEIETHFADPFRWHRLIEIDRDANRIVFRNGAQRV